MILLSIIGGILYRIRGGWPNLPRPIEQCLFCLPVILISLPSGLYVALILYALSVAATTTGHGQWMSLGYVRGKQISPERFDFVIKLLFGADPRTESTYTPNPDALLQDRLYWRCVAGMALSGLLITAPLFYISPILGLAGILKAPAYVIGWALFPRYYGYDKLRIGKFELNTSTALAEFLTGLFIWAALIGGHYVG